MEHFTPKEAFEFLRSNPDSVFIDCRCEMEYLFVGHPLGALLVPWSEAANREINPHFVAQVKRSASTEVPVVLICRSGARSREAASALENAGFTRVFNVLHGFEGELDEQRHRGAKSGWRHDGLPWEQS